MEPFYFSPFRLNIASRCPRCFHRLMTEDIAPHFGPFSTLPRRCEDRLKDSLDGRPVVVPSTHEIGIWRKPMGSVKSSALDMDNGLVVFGGKPDMFIELKSGAIIIVDFKSGIPPNPDAPEGIPDWYEGYERQLTIYGYAVEHSHTGNDRHVQDLYLLHYDPGQLLVGDEPDWLRVADLRVSFAWRTVRPDYEVLLEDTDHALGYLAWPWLPPAAPDCLSCFLAKHGRLPWDQAIRANVTRLNPESFRQRGLRPA